MSLLNPDPTCTVNATATTDGVNVTASSSVTIALADTAGVKQWNLSCINTDENNVAATVTAGLTINLVAKTATFTAPAAGSALIFQSKVNNGLNSDGTPNPAFTTTFGVYVLTGTGLRVGAFGEKTEGSATFGWVVKVNEMIRNATLGAVNVGNGLQYSGGIISVKPLAGNYVTVSASGVGVNATTTSTSGALVARDGSGNIACRDIACNATTASGAYNGTEISISAGMDVGTTLTVGGSSEFQGNVSVQGTFNSDFEENLANPKFAVATTETRVVPFQPILRTGSGWSYATDLWTNGTVGTILELPIDPPNGARIDSFTIYYTGAAAHAALPAVMPAISLAYRDSTAGTTNVVANSTKSDASANTAAFQTRHTIISNNSGAGINHTVDKTTRRYYILITAESGANSLVGATFGSALVTWTRPSSSKIGLD